VLRHYLKISWRNLLRNKVHSFINISGLSAGLAVSISIGLWIHDEFSFNTCHRNYAHIAKVLFNCNYNNERIYVSYNPYVMADELRLNYKDNFRDVVLSTFTVPHILSYGDKKFKKTGNFMEPGAPVMLDLRMLRGDMQALYDPSSILLSESVAEAIFGSSDPLGKTLVMDNMHEVTVKGIYEDIPYNSDFRETFFIAPWKLNLIMNPGIQAVADPWNYNKFQVFVWLNDQVDAASVSRRIKDIRRRKMDPKLVAQIQPDVFLYPMKRWHLYPPSPESAHGAQRIDFVWLFGVIGLFVLLLACINFMNLSTARSEHRAREVGILKTIGAGRRRIVFQFFSESTLSVLIAFMLSIVWVLLTLPVFNRISGKEMSIPWTQPLFWILSILFSLITGFIAGLYPAFYLSSFNPVKVLKGTFRLGRLAALPRKALVVLQFVVSVILIIGTIVIYRQIQHGRNRPVGYDMQGLIMIDMNPDIERHFNEIRQRLRSDGAIVEMGESVNTTTSFNIGDVNINWKGKDPGRSAGFAISNISYEYGRTIGWQLLQGRDFSREFPTDSLAFILNEAAAKAVGFTQPLGGLMEWNGKTYHIIGVIKDILFENPYQPVTPSIFHMSGGKNLAVTMRLNPSLSPSAALNRIAAVFNRAVPAYPFDYKFVDLEHDYKFKDEERVGLLSGYFAMLAIFISCLGLYGMASFMAEQRQKEIGVRKVLGASVFDLCCMLVIDFVKLVVIALLVAVPIAYMVVQKWLVNYEYRTAISWWIFVLAGAGALTITVLTVGRLAIKAALQNPVKSIRAQ